MYVVGGTKSGHLGNLIISEVRPENAKYIIGILARDPGYDISVPRGATPGLPASASSAPHTPGFQSLHM
jgi:hypothetical protein